MLILIRFWLVFSWFVSYCGVVAFCFHCLDRVFFIIRFCKSVRLFTGKEASNSQIALKRLTSFACRANQGLSAAQHLILRKHSLDAKVVS